MNYEPGSYRDRNGRVFYANGLVYRGLSARALNNWKLLAATKFFKQNCQNGNIVATELVAAGLPQQPNPSDHWAGVLKHQRIPFVSYPYEWPFGMLKDAAILQLELLSAALDEDFSLKDGSAYNIQWQGARPIFIDVPSFEPIAPGEPWTGYRQFCQTMLFPLFLQSHKNIAFHPWLRGRLEGIEPGECRNLMTWRDTFRSGVLAHVILHARLQHSFAGSTRNVREALRSAGFGKALIQANVRKLLKTVQRLRWSEVRSAWSEYSLQNSYADSDRKRKERFVQTAMSGPRRSLVWDLGCNTGNFSRIAAANADYVVAMDSDHLTVERLYQSLKAEKTGGILPLVCDLADASPNLGWRGLERKSLADRGRPSLTFCLALIHHIVIGANIPLREFIDWLAGLGTDLVIEFVTKGDPMVKALLRNKRDDYADYELPLFERWLAERFQIVAQEPLESGTRVLFHAISRQS